MTLVKFIETECRLSVPGAGGWGNGELVLNVYRVSVWDNEKEDGDGWW